MKVDISVLLPTRGRTEALAASLMSLVDLADDASRLQFLLAFDDDDQSSQNFFKNEIAPEIDAKGARYQALRFVPMGYVRLNEYVNQLGARASGQWLMFWNDDAVMETKGWDSRISTVDRFRVLRMPTHNQHPYAIFPIVPRQWIEVFGYLSAHQISDAWISQVAYMVGIMENIDVQVTHRRHDLTGDNLDDTYKKRIMLEGRPDDPRDFNHITWRRHRHEDCAKLGAYLEGQGEDITWWKNVCALKQDPWEFMLSEQQDPNHQVKQFPKPIKSQ